MHINGACHCGSISFRAEIDPSRVMVCHCTDCQTLSGSPFRAVVAAPMASFELRGEPKSYVKVAQSGNRRAQVFCPECGTPLYATAHIRRHSPWVRRTARSTQACRSSLAALRVALALPANLRSRVTGTTEVSAGAIVVRCAKNVTPNPSFKRTCLRHAA